VSVVGLVVEEYLWMDRVVKVCLWLNWVKATCQHLARVVEVGLLLDRVVEVCLWLN